MSLPQINVLELFSGIGGWAESLRQSYESMGQTSDCMIVEAIDINDASNRAYSHNFSSTKLICKSIESLKLSHFESLNCNCWCMSPPCQPFTRNNTSASRDNTDNRSDALLYLLLILEQLSSPPQFIFMENVVGFEVSQCCEQVTKLLRKLNYTFEEFILTPSQFGVPNERPRYYLTACKNSVPVDNNGIEEFVFVERSILRSLHSESLEGEATVNSIGSYLDCSLMNDKAILERVLVPASLLDKSAGWCFDICAESDATSACFTKSYSRYIKGTGSVVYVPSTVDLNSTSDQPSQVHDFRSNPEKRKFNPNWKDDLLVNSNVSESKERTISYGNLRYFTPKELLNIFGFSKHFNFPDSVSVKKSYELIANSLNVTVVKNLLTHALLVPRADTSDARTDRLFLGCDTKSTREGHLDEHTIQFLCHHSEAPTTSWINVSS